MPTFPSLALVVPLLDEEALVEAVAADILAVFDAAGLPGRLVLVDNGSRDRTGPLVDQLAVADDRIVPVHLARNAGYGGGILAGLAAAWPLVIDGRPAQLLGWMWGDGQVDPAVLPGLVAACADGAALARVRRVKRQDGLQRLVVTRCYAAVAAALGIGVQDINGCPKLFRRAALEGLDLRASDWFLDFEAVVGLLEADARIDSLPATMRPRAAGRSKVRPATLVQFLANLAHWKRTGQREGRHPLPSGCYQCGPGGLHEP